MEMRKFSLILLALLIIFPLEAYSAAPTRPYNYISHTTIDPNQNNTNENTLYAYLQAGVDTYAPGSIPGNAISSGAAIPYSSLNLIGSIVNADVSASAGIVGSKLDLSSPGIIGGTSPANGTFTNLTATTTFKLTSTHQGDILYDNGTSLVRLIPGTSGQFLKTQGASANPIWATASSSGVQVFTSNGTFTAPTGITKVYLSMVGGGGGGRTSAGGGAGGGGGGAGAFLINYPFTVIPANNYSVTVGAGGTTGNAGSTTSFDSISVSGGGSGVASVTGGTGPGGFDGTVSSSAPNFKGGNGSNGDGGGGGGYGGASFAGSGGAGAAAGGGCAGAAGTAAASNTGAGGGGGECNLGVGGAGGSGIVIVTY